MTIPAVCVVLDGGPGTLNVRRQSSWPPAPLSPSTLTVSVSLFLSDDIQCHAERDTVRDLRGFREDRGRHRSGSGAASEQSHHLLHPTADEEVLWSGVRVVQKPQHHRVDQEGL